MLTPNTKLAIEITKKSTFGSIVLNTETSHGCTFQPVSSLSTGSCSTCGIICPMPINGDMISIATRNASSTTPMQMIFPRTGLVISRSNFDIL